MRREHVRPPVVLVAHGSPDHRSRAVVREIAAASRATAAFLDFDAPHPVAVLKALADIGHRRATLVPLLLSHAYHGRVDVPRVAADAMAERPRLSVEVTDHVGGAHLLPTLLRGLPDADDPSVPARQHRVPITDTRPAPGQRHRPPDTDELSVPTQRRSRPESDPHVAPARWWSVPGSEARVVSTSRWSRPEPGAQVAPARPSRRADDDTRPTVTTRHPRLAADAVVLASAGTRDHHTLANLDALAAELGHRSGLPALTAYASAAKPTVAEAVADLHRRGATRVAVASYFIAPGVLHDRVVTAATAAGAIGVTPPLGACDELVAAIVRRSAATAAAPDEATSLDVRHELVVDPR